MKQDHQNRNALRCVVQTTDLGLWVRLRSLLDDLNREMRDSEHHLGQTYSLHSDRHLDRFRLKFRAVNHNLGDPPLTALRAALPAPRLDPLSHLVHLGLPDLLDIPRRNQALHRLLHELSRPLAAIRSVLQEIQLQLAGTTPNAPATSVAQHLETIWAWSDLQAVTLENIRIRALTDLLPDQRSARFQADILEAALRHISILLKERNLPNDVIEFVGTASLGPLTVDVPLFRQVFANLLSNAILYASPAPHRPRIEVRAAGNKNRLEFRVADDGMGIEAGLEEVVFEEGFRAPGAAQKHVARQGLGLWVARRIVEAHGGRIRVENLSGPTVLLIDLPVGSLPLPGGGPAPRLALAPVAEEDR